MDGKKVSGSASKKIQTCICVEHCDCENPPPDDWDGKDGVWHISEECPVHNLWPDPHPECLIHKSAIYYKI